MKTIALAGLVLALSACATPRSGHDLAFGYAGDTRTVRVEEGRLWGPTVDVRKFEDEYRGTWNGRTIELRVEADHVMGSIGTLPIDIHVKEENGILALTGSVGGRAGSLEMTDDQINGEFSACGYELKKAEVGYEGLRCGLVTTLRLPEGWSELSAPERGAFLALVLAS